MRYCPLWSRVIQGKRTLHAIFTCYSDLIFPLTTTLKALKVGVFRKNRHVGYQLE